MSKGNRKFYVKDEQLDMEEDFTNEFKGHSNITLEEIPPWCTIPGSNRMSRAPISKTICGFLNTGEGGTIYLAISDDGIVLGRSMTQYTMDHLMVSVNDTLSRYTPPVESHRYNIKFVPVVSTGTTEEIYEKHLKQIHRAELAVDPIKRQKDHILDTHKNCWCHNDCTDRRKLGCPPTEYVVEIHIRKWNPEDDRNQYGAGEMKAHPIHQDETGVARSRRHASVIPINFEEVTQLATQQVSDYYTPIVQKLQEELDKLDNKIPDRGNDDDRSGSNRIPQPET